MNAFGDFIRERRLQKKLTNRAIAKELGVSPELYSRMERGINPPWADKKKVSKLIETLGLQDSEQDLEIFEGLLEMAYRQPPKTWTPEKLAGNLPAFLPPDFPKAKLKLLEGFIKKDLTTDPKLDRKAKEVAKVKITPKKTVEVEIVRKPNPTGKRKKRKKIDPATLNVVRSRIDQHHAEIARHEEKMLEIQQSIEEALIADSGAKDVSVPPLVWQQAAELLGFKSYRHWRTSVKASATNTQPISRSS